MWPSSSERGEQRCSQVLRMPRCFPKHAHNVPLPLPHALSFNIKSPLMHDISVDGFAERTVRSKACSVLHPFVGALMRCWELCCMTCVVLWPARHRRCGPTAWEPT